MTAAPARPGAALEGEEGGLALVLGVEDERWLDPAFAPDEAGLRALLRRAAEAAFAGAGLPPSIATELGVTLTGDEAVQTLNAEWRGKDRPTNVLSFPLAELQPGEVPGPMLGDLVLACPTVLAEAKLEGRTPADHLTHLVVHGVLHCLGFDHVEADDAEEMETLETAILAGLGIADPYADEIDAGDRGPPDPDETHRPARS